MSIKTLRKRIALVAVSALGAGVLSVAVVPSANATTNFAEGATSVTMTASTAGVCQAYDSTSRIAVVNRVQVSSVTLPVNDGTDNLAQNTKAVFTITGPAVFTNAPGTTANSATASLSADAKKFTVTASTSGNSADSVPDLTIRPTGDGEVKITPATVNSSGVATALNAISIYFVSACDNGSYSATTSKSKLDTSATALTAASAAVLTGDTTGAATRTYAEKAHLALWLTDKYGAEIDETASYLTANATNGVEVSFDNSTFAGTAVKTTNLNDAIVSVKLPTGVVAPTTTTVTVALNGTTVATRSIKFTGQPAKIVVGSIPANVATSGTDTLTVVVQDSAGNQLAGWTPEAGAATSNVNGASVGSFNASSATATVNATLTAGSAEGASQTTIRVKLDDGTYVVSDAIKFLTSTASIATFTIAADKAVYAPGEVVTITVTGKNAAGNPVADTTTLGGTVTWVGSGLTKVSADPAAGDTPTNGAWTYKFYASTTEGNYGFSLKTSSASVTVTDQTGIFQVKSGAISNAEVLASIVKLIAAINKQIRALQKSLRR